MSFQWEHSTSNFFHIKGSSHIITQMWAAFCLRVAEIGTHCLDAFPVTHRLKIHTAIVATTVYLLKPKECSPSSSVFFLCSTKILNLERNTKVIWIYPFPSKENSQLNFSSSQSLPLVPQHASVFHRAFLVLLHKLEMFLPSHFWLYCFSCLEFLPSCQYKSQLPLQIPKKPSPNSMGPVIPSSFFEMRLSSLNSYSLWPLWCYLTDSWYVFINFPVLRRIYVYKKL